MAITFFHRGLGPGESTTAGPTPGIQAGTSAAGGHIQDQRLAARGRRVNLALFLGSLAGCGIFAFGVGAFVVSALSDPSIPEQTIQDCADPEITYTVTNTGDVPISGITISNRAASDDLAPGESCQLKVR